MKDFFGKIAVITGVGSGFGREFARIGAALGMHLVLADVQQDALDAIRGELEAQDIHVLALKIDVSRAEDVQALADATMQRFGAVHLVFNNAGVGSGGLIWENSLADWQWVLGVNLWGVIHGMRIFMPLMLECAKADPEYRGHMVNTASMAGLLNPPNMGVYNVSKHAVVSLSETLYQDLQLINAPIGASVLCPYFVPTGISQSQRNRPADMPGNAPTASQKAAQIGVAKAVSSGKLTATQIAETTFNAIRNQQFYILSHPHMMDDVERRFRDISTQRNPSDPFATQPELKAMLRAALPKFDKQ